MLGYKNDELKDELQTWVDLCHPDDLKKAEEDISASQSNPNKLYENIHRLRHKEGHWVWILDRGQSVFDENGKVIRMVGFHTDISDTKELEQELRDSQQQFESFMENIPANIIIKDENRRIVYANTIAKGFFNNKDIIGLKAEDILSKDDVANSNRVDDYITKNGSIDDISKYTNYNNETKTYHTMGFLLKDKKIGVTIFDITKEIENQHNAEQLSKIIDNSVNEVFIFAKDNLKFLYINKGAKNNIGYSTQEMLNMNPLDIKPTVTLELWDKLMEPLTSGKTNHISFSTIHQRKDGTTYPVDIYLQNIIYEETEAYVAIIIDTTERLKIQEKLKTQEEIMLAQSRHAAMGEMISMIAHQWRQPISIIAMGANNILADIDLDIVDNKNLQTSADTIISQTKELSNTIDDFRNFFKPNKELEDTLLEDVFNNALSVIGKSLENHGIKVALDVHSDTIKTHPRELMQVFINILKNAKEALVENEVEDKTISIIADNKSDNITIKICDNAGGIKKDIIGNIFNPYFKKKSEKNGTGLGLYMSKTIIEKHLSGTLKVYNKFDDKNNLSGVCFEISLPYNIT